MRGITHIPTFPLSGEGAIFIAATPKGFFGMTWVVIGESFKYVLSKNGGIPLLPRLATRLSFDYPGPTLMDRQGGGYGDVDDPGGGPKLGNLGNYH